MKTLGIWFRDYCNVAAEDGAVRMPTELVAPRLFGGGTILSVC